MTMVDALVRFPLGGVAHRRICESVWPKHNKRGFAAIKASRKVPVGFGYRVDVEMRADDAADLADYLEAVAAALDAMPSEQRGNERSKPYHVAAERIRAALERAR